MVDAMLATYNRMNPVNLSLITAIRDLIDPAAEPAKASPLPPPPEAPTAMPQKLPAPVNLNDMPNHVRETVLALSAAIPSPGTQVIPTLYRHLAIWPDFLTHLAPGLLDAMQRGEVEARMDDLNANMHPLIADVTDGGAFGPIGTRFRCHEFHYASIISSEGENLFEVEDAAQTKLGPVGSKNKSVSGSFMHLVDYI